MGQQLAALVGTKEVYMHAVSLRTMRVEEAAKVLGIGRSLAYRLVRDGQIPHIRLGDRVLIPRDAIEEMLKGRSPLAG
jgi:excisionase family DNA binding protein